MKGETRPRPSMLNVPFISIYFMFATNSSQNTASAYVSIMSSGNVYDSLRKLKFSQCIKSINKLSKIVFCFKHYVKYLSFKLKSIE